MVNLNNGLASIKVGFQFTKFQQSATLEFMHKLNC